MLLSNEDRKERDRKRMQAYRRKQGMLSRAEYDKQRRQAMLERVDTLAKLIKKHPEATQKELAKKMGMAQWTINKYVGIMKENETEKTV